MEIRSRDVAAPFTAPDGSTIRVLLDRAAGGAANQSLAEASLEAGEATERHYHGLTEEIYYVVEGTGEMEVEGARQEVGPGDAVLIPPGAWHQLRASNGGIRILCCCSPPYRDEDTHFAP
jgi:mannose-6-phosphate isomerase-like protein (cupin superfamily)